MKPFFITVDESLPLMIVPDSVAHMDGHPVLAFSYSIYKRTKANSDVTDTDKLGK